MFSSLVQIIEDPGRISLWTALAALAAIGQLGLLALNGVFVWRYLKATESLGQSTREQVDESRKLVILTREQMEANVKPALVARVRDGGVELINAGAGLALHLQLFSVLRGSTDTEIMSGLGPGRISFLEIGGLVNTDVRTAEPHVLRSYPIDPGSRSLRCEYTSLSDRKYFAVFDFSRDGILVEDTHFGEITK